MSAIRLILLLVVLGFFTLLLWQNWSPVLPLVFLGTQTQPLPLAFWILLSAIAGVITSLFISSCFGLSNYFASPRPRKRRQAVATAPPRAEAQRRSSEASYTAASNSYTTANPTSSPPKTDSTPKDDNDWESDTSNDWDFAADKQDTEKTPKSDIQDPVKDNTNYEASTEPKSSYRSGSVYSYSYREPSNSGVGRTESIYDAEYRVLTPPYQQTDRYQQTDKSEKSEDDDWGFEDDDDWVDEGENDSPRSQK